MTKQNHTVEPEELMAYLDGEFAAKQAANTAAHLEHCHECQMLAAELKEVSEMLQAWEVEASEPELSEEAAARLDERKLDKNGPLHQATQFRVLNPKYWTKPVGGLVAVGVIVALVVVSNLRLEKLALRSPSGMDSYYAPQSGAGAKTKAAMATHRAPAPIGTPAPVAGTVGLVKEQRNAEAEDQEHETPEEAGYKGPMIIRTADLAVTMTTLQFDKARSALDEILKRHHGHIGELSVNSPAGSARSLTATLRIPGNRLDAALNDLKGLGRVDKESQGGQEVTQEYIDLEARLANSRHTEQRLIDIQRERTGKLSDVLTVEMQIGRVRGEIERMEAQRKNMKNQVDFATVTLNVSEEYKAEIKAVPPSTSTRFRNAAVEGYRSVVDGIIAFLLWLLSAGPTLLLWAAILFFPARMVWRRVRRDRRDRAESP
jgi:anti-sigma factor RsiW